MPGMSGIDLAKAIKATPTLSDLKLVMLTSIGLRGDREVARVVGFDDFLTKPIRKHDLQHCIARIVGRLPVAEDDVVHCPNNQNPARHAHFPSHRLGRVLVVDDHGVNQQLAKLMLETFRHRVDVGREWD